MQKDHICTLKMGVRYVPGFAPAVRFLRSQILCGLFQNSFSMRFINQGPRLPPVYTHYTHAERPHMHVKEPAVVYVWVRWNMGTTNNPACTKGVRGFIMLKLDTIRKKKKNRICKEHKNTTAGRFGVWTTEPGNCTHHSKWRRDTDAHKENPIIF